METRLVEQMYTHKGRALLASTTSFDSRRAQKENWRRSHLTRKIVIFFNIPYIEEEHTSLLYIIQGSWPVESRPYIKQRSIAQQQILRSCESSSSNNQYGGGEGARHSPPTKIRSCLQQQQRNHWHRNAMLRLAHAGTRCVRRFADHTQNIFQPRHYTHFVCSGAFYFERKYDIASRKQFQPCRRRDVLFFWLLAVTICVVGITRRNISDNQQEN